VFDGTGILLAAFIDLRSSYASRCRDVYLTQRGFVSLNLLVLSSVANFLIIKPHFCGTTAKIQFIRAKN